VPDEVWDEAARHYTEPQLAALVVAIATINGFNRVNAATRQITGDYVARIVEAAAGAAAGAPIPGATSERSLAGRAVSMSRRRATPSDIHAPTPRSARQATSAAPAVEC
jgi:hypothetical protein